MPEADTPASGTETAKASVPDVAHWREELRLLLHPGNIGQFDHIELTEIIATPRGARTLNVLSVAVLAEGRPDVGKVEQTQFRNLQIRVDGFKDWRFGVGRTLRSLMALDKALEEFATTGVWALSGQALEVGNMWPEPAMFAPPDGTVEVPLNKILKNNFWAGSHVFRLTDRGKESFAPFFADRRRLQALSDAVSQDVPMAFAGLADLLGDIVIQLPVTILAPSVEAPRGAEHSEVKVAWRRRSAPRDLVVAARNRWDELLIGAAVSQGFRDTANLPINGHRQSVESETWDTTTGRLISATVSTSTLKTIEVDVHEVQHEPRLFAAPDLDGEPQRGRVELTRTRTIVVGEEAVQDANYWLSRRQDLEERRRLTETRDFVQYRSRSGSSDERVRALTDLRFLINKHGEAGVDLWDPYLTGEDLLQTLFWCSHGDAPLRGLTDGRDPPSSEPPDDAAPREPTTLRVAFPHRQRAVLERDKGNCQGLHLEYRTRRGPKGWGFHDRFLIFPNGRDGPRAWSLGTSVNSLGKAHHILQRVSNPAMVAGAFQDLWEALDEPQHVVWRSW
ncbi:hypothetical protein JKG68_08700 [Microvirga aerilata]|uniref:Uncharacterized protein n=1 Tax=Microvirga aerilata TaxID=670292 RepID=A0A937D1E5_9HYPH|nr:VPA1262 family N-terminal domain-containing protein [Microvirga aerilata]MBL0404040.1 hypothetical protein [Microvirga aerilata]